MATISDLHDDLLRRILYFTPAKEAASTAALARRWRSLWPSSGAVNLGSFSSGHDEHSFSEDDDRVRDAFLRVAVEALAVSHAPVRRLTFNLEGQSKRRSQVLDLVLCDPVARRVEDLRVRVAGGVSQGSSHSQVRLPSLSIGALPFESLRVLDISSRCQCLCTPHGAAEVALPRLQAMRLHRCIVPAKDLQGMIDAAPLLTTLQLDEVQLLVPWSPPSCRYCPRIRCPRVTTLVLADLSWRGYSWRDSIELHAPLLLDFRYRGFIRPFSLAPPATTEIAKADLHFVGDNDHRQGHDERCRLFWQFVNNFSNAKIMKLRLVHLEHVIVPDKRKTAELIAGDTVFSNLHRLDLQAFYTPGRRAGGVAFATFLRCCPMIRVLRLQLSTVDGDPSKSASRVQDFSEEEKGKLDHLCKSVDRFIRPRVKTGDFLGWRRRC